MYPGQNVVPGRCRLQGDVPDEHWSGGIGSPADSVSEPSTRDPQTDRAVVPNGDQLVCRGCRRLRFGGGSGTMDRGRRRLEIHRRRVDHAPAIGRTSFHWSTRRPSTVRESATVGLGADQWRTLPATPPLLRTTGSRTRAPTRRPEESPPSLNAATTAATLAPSPRRIRRSRRARLGSSSSRHRSSSAIVLLTCSSSIGNPIVHRVA